MQPTLRKPTRRDYAACWRCGQSTLATPENLQPCEQFAGFACFDCAKCGRRNYVESEQAEKPRLTLC